MLSGLMQRPLIKRGAIPLVQFWNSGVNAFRTTMVYAVETGVRGDKLYRVYRAQQPLLKHLYLESSAFERMGWRANPVFQRRDPLTSDELLMISRFKHDSLNGEYRMLMERRSTISMDGDLARFDRFAKTNYRLFPSLKAICQSLVSRHTLDASKEGIFLENVVESRRQFQSPDIHTKAKTALNDIMEHIIQRGAPGDQVRIYGNDRVITFVCSSETATTDGRKGWGGIHGNDEDLGWTIKAEEEPAGGLRIIVEISERSLASVDAVKRRSVTTQSLRSFSTVSYKDIIGWARFFVGAQPFQAYRLRSNDMLDISKTPVFQIIESSRKLIEPLAHNLTRALGG